MLAAYPGGRPVGVLVLAFRPNVALGGVFASVEELHVEPGARGQGAGPALVEAAGERCRARGISYVEVQTDDGAAGFYRKVNFELEPDVRVLSRSYLARERDHE